jgi:putative spermidine/putrescine transport system substrate-binding protein
MNGEVAMTYVPLSRALQAEKESGGKMKWIWSGGTCFGTGWCVPKGTPRAEEAQHFLRVCQDPEPQIELIETMGFGPANPEAAALVPDNLKRTNPTDPTNLATPGYGIADPVWYAEKYNETFEKWLQLISA